MLRLGNANAIVIQGLIAQKGLDCLKALISWEFENKPEEEGEGEEEFLSVKITSNSCIAFCNSMLL